MRWIVAALPFLMMSAQSQASSCQAVFPDPVSSSFADGTLKIDKDSQISGSDGFLDIANIVDNSRGSSCVTRYCQISGNLSQPVTLPTFEAAGNFDIYVPKNFRVSLIAFNYGDITVDKDASITFTSTDSTYTMDNFNVGKDSQVYFSQGTYFIDNFKIDKDAGIHVDAGDKVVIYVNDLDIDKDVQLNRAGDPSDLVIVSYQDIKIDKDVYLNALVYADRKITYDKDVVHNGAVHAREIQIDKETQINYDISGIDNIYDSAFCGVGTPQPSNSAVGFYQFEENSWDTTGDVIDSSGNGNNGSAFNGASPVFSSDSPASCSVLEVPNNTNNNSAGVTTGIDIDDMGNAGTISFWYKNSESWRGNGAKQLFDASNELRGRNNDKYFYLALTNSGQLQFGMEDRLDGDYLHTTQPVTTEADTWVHIAVSWDMVNRQSKIYVDGSEVRLSTLRYRLFSRNLGNMGDLFIGDNATDYLVYSGTNDSAYGEFDNVRIYDFVQTESQINSDIQADTDAAPVCAELHHYEVTHVTQALTCDSTNVTIKACANESCSELVDSEVTVNLSSGDWSSGSQAVFTEFTELTLEQPSAGIHTVTVVGANANSMAANDTVCTANCEIDFVNAGFQFYDSQNPYSTILPDVIAETSLSRIGLRAVQDSNGACSALLTGPKDVTIGFDCVSDATATYSSNTCQVPFAGVPITGDGSGNNQGLVSLNFNANGEASLAGLQYADAGRLSLSAEATVDGVDVESGSTSFDSIPNAIEVSSNIVAPSTVSGTPFEIQVVATGANGTVLPSFAAGNLQMRLFRVLPSDANGHEAVAQISAADQITSGLSGSFENVLGANFTNGTYTYASAQLDDVGTYSIEVQDSGYLGQTISGNTLSLGRFTPAYFSLADVITPRFENQCSTGNFTYVGQSFDFETGREPSIEVTAFNANGQVTLNYDSGLVTVSPSTTVVSYTNNASYSGSLTTSGGSVSVDAGSAFDGKFTVEVLNTNLLFEKIATPSGANGSPFTADIDLTFDATFFTDSDGVCYQSAYPGICESYAMENINGADFRYGRLRLESTYGPETEVLAVPMYADYFNNGAWVINGDDNCTVIAMTQASGQIEVSDASQGDLETNITGSLAATVSTGTLSMGRSDGGDLNLGPAITPEGAALVGTVLVELDPSAASPAWAEYLNIDWNLDGVIDVNDKPSATVSFGHYRGNDRTLHWREQFD